MGIDLEWLGEFADRISTLHKEYKFETCSTQYISRSFITKDSLFSTASCLSTRFLGQKNSGYKSFPCLLAPFEVQFYLVHGLDLGRLCNSQRPHSTEEDYYVDFAFNTEM